MKISPVSKVAVCTAVRFAASGWIFCPRFATSEQERRCTRAQRAPEGRGPGWPEFHAPADVAPTTSLVASTNLGQNLSAIIPQTGAISGLARISRLGRPVSPRRRVRARRGLGMVGDAGRRRTRARHGLAPTLPCRCNRLSNHLRARREVAGPIIDFGPVRNLPYAFPTLIPVRVSSGNKEFPVFTLDVEAMICLKIDLTVGDVFIFEADRGRAYSGC